MNEVNSQSFDRGREVRKATSNVRLKDSTVSLGNSSLTCSSMLAPFPSQTYSTNSRVDFSTLPGR